MKILRAIALASILTLAACGSANEEEQASEENGAPAEGEGGEGVVATPAAGYFELQPGLWERSAKQLMGTAPAVERLCIDAGTRNRIIPLTQARGFGEECKVVEQSEATAFGVIFRLQCAKPDAREVSGSMRFDNGIVKTDLQITKPDGDLITSANVETKRVGDCPAGMQPGDVADQSGKVIGSIRG
ncbi:MAG TPA: DUF3617 family protein [Allosphingosinicella sp.]